VRRALAQVGDCAWEVDALEGTGASMNAPQEKNQPEALSFPARDCEPSTDFEPRTPADMKKAPPAEWRGFSSWES
jgi:hypothetical protein